MGACFTDNAPVFLGLYNGFTVNSLYFITNFEASVDPNVFSVPSTCNAKPSPFHLAASLSFAKLKKFKAPVHPLLF